MVCHQNDLNFYQPSLNSQTWGYTPPPPPRRRHCHIPLKSRRRCCYAAPSPQVACRPYPGTEQSLLPLGGLRLFPAIQPSPFDLFSPTPRPLTFRRVQRRKLGPSIFPGLCRCSGGRLRSVFRFPYGSSGRCLSTIQVLRSSHQGGGRSPAIQVCLWLYAISASRSCPKRDR